MPQHKVTVITLAKTDTTADAVTDPSGTVDTIDITADDVVALVSSTGPVLGVALSGVAVEPGDTIVVTGAVGRIPDYQVGMSLTVDDTGVAHLVNAGAIANALAKL